MEGLAYKDRTANLISLLPPLSIGTNLYTLGSMKPKLESQFDPRVNDVDVLVVADYSTIEEYVDRFEQSKGVATILKNSTADLYDVFFMSREVAKLHFLCFSVLAGGTELEDEDLLVGDSHRTLSLDDYVPSEELRWRLYQVQAHRLCQEYVATSPNSNTEKARKTAKLLLRLFKVLICASCGVRMLKGIERELLLANDFKSIQQLFYKVVGAKVSIDPLFQRTLRGYSIDDWSEWMVAQEEIATQLLGLEDKIDFKTPNYLFYDTLAIILQDMLTMGVKHVINSPDKKTYLAEVASFIDRTSGYIVRLALAGVNNLKDFQASMAPPIVVEAYHEVTDYLAGKKAKSRTFISALILLEYTAKQSITYANHRLS